VDAVAEGDGGQAGGGGVAGHPVVQRAALAVLAGQDMRQALRPGDDTQGVLESAIVDEALRLRRAEMRDVALEAAETVVEGIAHMLHVDGWIEIKDGPSGE
jgi:hypothetical protein